MLVKFLETLLEFYELGLLLQVGEGSLTLLGWEPLQFEVAHFFLELDLVWLHCLVVQSWVISLPLVLDLDHKLRLLALPVGFVLLKAKPTQVL